MPAGFLPSLTKRVAIPLAVLGTAALIGLAPQAAQAEAPAATGPAQTAAGWLTRQMTDGKHLDGQYGPDPGLTIDAILAFAAAGAGADHARDAIAWLADPAVLDFYSGNGTTEIYTGGTAKLILAAEVTGKDPTAFAGQNLVAQLLSLQGASGRFTDKSQYGDYANALGHTLAVIALKRGSHATEAESAATFLVSTQCDDGGFPLDFGKPVCDSEVDSTAFVVQALLLTGHAEAAGKALDWLDSKQQPDGGFRDESSVNIGENANSTGIAAQALRVGGRTAAADDAVTFLTSQQVGCAGPAAQQGAIAYRPLDTQNAGETGFHADTAPRATAQAILGLTGVGLVTLTLTGATTDAPSLICATPTATPTTAATTTTAADAVATTDPPILAVTGTSVTPVVVSGAALVLLGTGMLLLLRIRRRTEA